MYLNREVALLFLCFFFAPLAVYGSAQEPAPDSKWKLVKIEITGLKVQKSEEVISLTQLQVGQVVEFEAIKAASKRLADTGLFKQVSFRYRYSGDRMEATFEVEEARSEKLRCVFDNFVWFTDQELQSTIAKEIPGFDGTFSRSDLLVEKVKVALTRLLKAGNVKGEVVYEINEDVGSGPGMHLFKVKNEETKVCSIQFAGANANIVPGLSREMQPLIKTDYSRSDTGLFVRAALTPLYHDRGYLKVRFLVSQAQPGSGGSCKNGVVVTLPIEEGPLFYWEKAIWTGNQAYSAEELDSVLGMKPGAVADESKFVRGFADVKRHFGRKGYVTALLIPVPVMEDEKQRVTFKVSITEGPQYRMGELTITGLPEADIKKLKDRWRLRPGDVFDSFYPGESVRKATKEGVLQIGSSVKGFEVKTTPDPQKLTVDVLIEFK